MFICTYMPLRCATNQVGELVNLQLKIHMTGFLR